MYDRLCSRACLFSFVAVAAFACADRLPTNPEVANQVQTVTEGVQRSRYPSEALFHRLSSEIPGFGGYWWDLQGNLHVNVIDLTRTPNAKAALAPVFARYIPSGHFTPAANRAIIVHAANFSFTQLSAWRDDLFRAIAPIREVQSIGVDERLNQVTVGVVSNAATTTISDIIERLGIPADAVTVLLEPPARELQQYLSDRVDPVAGGLKITTYGESGRSYPCTVGVNTLDGLFLTNSHCSDTYGPEPTYSSTAYQPYFEAATLLGIERFDAPTFSLAEDANCPSTQNFCRYSDAALYQYQARHPGSAGEGVIYRTVFAGYGPGQLGSVIIDGTLTIVDELPYPEQGLLYDKIGQATGWTYGVLSETCRNVRPENSVYWRLCSDQVDAAAYAGDSGSPVFYWHGNDDVALVGLLFAGHSGLFYLSPLESIWLELGYFPVVPY